MRFKYNILFGFSYGKDKVFLGNVTGSDFSLNSTSSRYDSFPFNVLVPDNVWDTTYGEIVLTYTAKYGPVRLDYDKLSSGFSMTYVENVYLKNIEELLTNLNSTFWQSFGLNLTLDNLALINRTYWELQQNMTALKGSLGDLDNTRRVVVILAITTVFFVATTIYMVMRKPREYL
jgi:hypothetical protein